mmetsp:Transcript_402/g.859  ORF Transcript_402/g.859 Transcript_402/m.859 type:complete len:438 (+) Transcript_402:138-1451(+)
METDPNTQEELPPTCGEDRGPMNQRTAGAGGGSTSDDTSSITNHHHTTHTTDDNPFTHKDEGPTQQLLSTQTTTTSGTKLSIKQRRKAERQRKKRQAIIDAKASGDKNCSGDLKDKKPPSEGLSTLTSNNASSSHVTNENGSGDHENKACTHRGNIIEITDYQAPELDVYARLSEVQLLNRFDPTKGMFIAESSYVIMRALEGGCVPVSILAERSGLNSDYSREAVEKACSSSGGGGEHDNNNNNNIPIYVSGMEVLTKLTGFQLTKGMICAMKRPRPRTIEDVLRNTRRIVVLEKVQNPTNVGAIFRSAAALGMDAILLTPGCADPLYRRSARVSMGAVFQIPWTYLREGNWMKELRSLGYKTAAMALRDDSYNIDAPELREVDRLAIVLGAEGRGLLEDTMVGCDYTVKIPMYHGVDSLNVAAASALAFWELRKR